MAGTRRRWLRRLVVLSGLAAFARWREAQVARNLRDHDLRDRL